MFQNVFFISTIFWGETARPLHPGIEASWYVLPRGWLSSRFFFVLVNRDIDDWLIILVLGFVDDLFMVTLRVLFKDPCRNQIIVPGFKV
jgi:hypothetical protein